MHPVTFSGARFFNTVQPSNRDGNNTLDAGRYVVLRMVKLLAVVTGLRGYFPLRRLYLKFISKVLYTLYVFVRLPLLAPCALSTPAPRHLSSFAVYRILMQCTLVAGR